MLSLEQPVALRLEPLWNWANGSLWYSWRMLHLDSVKLRLGNNDLLPVEDFGKSEILCIEANN